MHFLFPLSFVAVVLLTEIQSGEQQNDTKPANPPQEYANENLDDGTEPIPYEDMQCSRKGRLQGKAFETLNYTRKWKTMNIYIERDDYKEKEIKIINQAAFRLYELLKPCGVHIGVYGPDETPSGDYVRVMNGGACYSDVGRMGGGQNLSLRGSKAGGRCVSTYIVLHEMLHILGFGHEHERRDRDEHIEVLWDNIIPDLKFNFDLEEGNPMGIPYNEQSIMHYEDTAFAKEKGMKTMKSKKGKELGWKGDKNHPLQESDIEMIKKVYCNDI